MVEKAWELGKSKKVSNQALRPLSLPHLLSVMSSGRIPTSPWWPGTMSWVVWEQGVEEWLQKFNDAVHWASHKTPTCACKSGSYTSPGGTRRCQKADDRQKSKVKVQRGQCTGTLRPANGWCHGPQSWMLGHCCKEPREHLFYLQPGRRPAGCLHQMTAGSKVATMSEKPCFPLDLLD